MISPWNSQLFLSGRCAYADGKDLANIIISMMNL
jgi:hypothetical protein